ncbi:alpha/beta hydrolase [Arthrobacter sp. Sa2CUA1]|uniref:Alpha/beta hydrolase n=1 Tax=Arthrobacter gallicola TaxID=2762225 RepID=A0ABR8UUV6_9MICC|nr:alpha/beta hydrolase [Arthrobacter gallicola]MBD7996165.1 alpha/beta hydrolase [Arthrobacter gallicola]
MTNRPTNHVLEVPGARIVYDVAEVRTSAEPPLLLFGSPMDASGFTALAARFSDRTTLTYDPRGTGRSETSDTECSPELHAQDLHALVTDLGSAQVDIFASSGGAVNALAFAAKAGEQIRILVVHEPPLAGILPDRHAALAGIEAILQTYQEHGRGAAMARFMEYADWRGEFPAGSGHLQPADLPDPGDPEPGTSREAATRPEADDGTRDDPLFARNLRTCTAFQPDFDGLRDGPASIVVGVGEESSGTMAARAAKVTADRLGTLPVTFPGGHSGFMGPEAGPGAGDPDAFAGVLRQVLDGR